jgi:TonB-dependent Receptor Plug Domain
VKVILLLVLACAFPLSARAQSTTTFIADVADAATGQPLADADVILMDLHRIAHTNWLGEVRLTGIDSGAHRVRVRKFGYVPADLELPFRGDSVGDVFMLSAMPVGLDPVKVTASIAPAYLRPFAERLAKGIGHFLTEDDLAVAPIQNVPMLISTRFPGIRLERDTDGSEVLVSTRGFMSHMHVSACPISVYLDGVPTGQTDAWNFVRTWDLAGVEYYDQADTPAQYQAEGTMCGVLLLWSRQGG